MGPDAVIFASYGTTSEGQLAASIEPVAAALGAAFPGVPVAHAYTSAKVRRVLDARGAHVPDVGEALGALVAEGARDVLVVPGHVVAGEAFALVERAVAEARAAGVPECVRLAAPLLACADDVRAAGLALAERWPARPGEAVLLVGHGADATAGLPYAALGYRLLELGRGDLVVACMHGYPDLEATLRLLARKGAARVRLVPLMLTAGKHARSDLAGAAPDSWRGRLEAAGYEVVPELEGLGSVPAFQELYVAHARAAAGC